MYVLYGGFMGNRFSLFDRVDFNRHTKMLVIAIFDALISQFYFDSLPFDFKFSISVAILPIYYYFDRKLNPIITSLYVLVVGLLFRTLTMANVAGGFQEAFWLDFPFIYFDLLYGIIFFYLFYKHEKAGLWQWALVVVFADWAGNTVEALARFGPDFLISSNSTFVFLIVALLRVIISLCVLTFLKQYSRLIRKDEHEIRYKQLLMLTSDLKSEAYFMQKNMDYIEYVMTDAYKLYSDIDEVSIEEAKTIALKIATDIHEIKKNYSRVVEGLGKITDDEVKTKQMKITELVRILRYSITRSLDNKQSKIQFITNVHTHRLIGDHYLIMSVLRNLVNNAIEELEKNNPSGWVRLKYQEDSEYYIFTISDNGQGIDANDLQYIFEAGFSTKFNEETGDICRGVGLALVKDIVENRLNGRIEVKSIKSVGTEFFIYIKREYIGG